MALPALGAGLAIARTAVFTARAAPTASAAVAAPAVTMLTVAGLTVVAARRGGSGPGGAAEEALEFGFDGWPVNGGSTW